jgi:hypothetical protein
MRVTTATEPGAGARRVHAKSGIRFIQPDASVSSWRPGAARKIPSFETSESRGGSQSQRSGGRRYAPSDPARGRPPRNRREDGNELGAAVNNRDPLKRRFQPEHARSASREPGTRSALKTSASMTIGPRDRTKAHDSMAARKAAPSSSLRSSITISSCGGKGRARRRSSSTGSSRCCSRLSGACVDALQLWAAAGRRSCPSTKPRARQATFVSAQ